jgi:hypothetical protein
VQVSFQVTFVDRFNTSIVTSGAKYLDNLNVSVFYNCGDPDWSYIASDYLIGPNYNLEAIVAGDEDEKGQQLQ